jgi:hypothetical protein
LAAFAADLAAALTAGLAVTAFAFVGTVFWGLAATCLEALARGTTVFAGAFALAAGAALFDDSLVVLGAAALADAFEAFAFTTTPFSASAATMVVPTIGPSCRGEGDRR